MRSSSAQYTGLRFISGVKRPETSGSPFTAPPSTVFHQVMPIVLGCENHAR